jgi:hypothetical protein
VREPGFRERYDTELSRLEEGPGVAGLMTGLLGQPCSMSRPTCPAGDDRSKGSDL